MNFKSVVYSVFLALLFCQKAFSQATPQDCIGAIPICQPVYIQNVASPSAGAVADLTATNQDCLLGFEHLTTWYIINVVSPGTLVFTLTPASQTDYDFAVWDVTPNGCGQSVCDIVHNNPPVRCNYASTSSGILTGLSTTATQTSIGAGGPGFSSAINAVAGQSFVILIDNFSVSNVGYTLDFSASTVSITDTVAPVYNNVTTSCGYSGDNLIVTMSEPVKCNTIAADGSDFVVTSAAGTSYPVLGATSQNCIAGGSFSNTINLHMASSLPAGNYTLHAQTGSDGNTLSDNCGNTQLPSNSLVFNLLPPPAPPTIIKMDTPACNRARLVISRPIKCSTVAVDGSDFKITGPSAVKVKRASPISCQTIPYHCGSTVDITDTIDVEFDHPIAVAGTYSISVIWGSDGNPIADTCDASIGNTFNWVVSDQGYIYADATPNVLCAPGYVNLTAVATILAPPPPVSCGTNNTQCITPSNPFLLGSTTAGGTSTNTPFYGVYMDAKTQMLFTSTQLKAAGLKSGTITKVAFNITSKNSTAPYNNFTVKMKCTNTNALTDYEPGTSIVYGPVSYSSVAGTNTITLDNPYDWNDSMNLIVEVCYHNTSFTSNDEVQTTTGVMPGAVIHNHADNSVGCAMPSDLADYPPSPDRPNITFTECSPGASPQKYQWTPSTFVEDSTSNNTLAYVPATTTYQIQIMDSNYCYRRDTATVIVSVRHPQLLGPVNDTAICIHDTIQLHAGGGVNYIWFPANGLSCTNCSDPYAQPTTTTTYSVAIFDQYGCSDTLKRKIVVNPLPVITLTSDTTILYGQSVQLNALVPGGVYFLWDPITGLNNPNIPNPVATPVVTTKYAVLAIDTNQCHMKDTVKVTVRTNVPIMVPSAFTPNGDGINDVFRIPNITFQKVIEFRVFNRWGQEVCNTTDNSKGWDGTYGGTLQEMGVYNYIIRLAWPDGKVETYKGDVTLLR